MSGLSSDAGLEPGLSVEHIESRLIEEANRHHLAERNIAYWLHEIDRRGLHKARGFSSIGDYAMELVEIKPRKAQYLVFIASRLESLPKIRDAFDAGDLPWTKAREIVSVATVETEAEWLEKARTLSNRDLEQEVRRHDGRGSGKFATLTISLPVEILDMWNDAYELAERISGTPLEKWQVLEPTLAEFLGTHLPTDAGAEPTTREENDLDAKVRNAVFDRDGWQCKFPGCTMRKHLDPHHINYRSHHRDDSEGNLTTLCRIHHGLVHRGICKVSGTVGVDLKFERPQLVSEAKHSEDADVEAKPEPPAVDDDDESWRDEVVADIFDGPPAPQYEPPFEDYNDFMNHWIAKKKARDLEYRAKRRRAGRAHVRADEHVCAGSDGAESSTLSAGGEPDASESVLARRE